MTTEFYDDERPLLPLPVGEGWGEGQTGSCFPLSSLSTLNSALSTNK